MSFELVISGHIESATHRLSDGKGTLADENFRILTALPEQDEWPWLARAMFAISPPWPQGTFRTPVIHFGLSLKDDPHDEPAWPLWQAKFEELLRRLYWISTVALILPEQGQPQLVQWLATPQAVGALAASPPQPIREWTVSVQEFHGS